MCVVISVIVQIIDPARIVSHTLCYLCKYLSHYLHAYIGHVKIIEIIIYNINIADSPVHERINNLHINEYIRSVSILLG